MVNMIVMHYDQWNKWNELWWMKTIRWNMVDEMNVIDEYGHLEGWTKIETKDWNKTLQKRK